MSEARVVAALAALFLLATGCITADYDDGNKLRLERIEDIEPGETSKKDIVVFDLSVVARYSVACANG